MIAIQELERLRALEAYSVLDTAPEPAFDRITALAADLFDVPIALISLVDRNRQWFKSRHGLEATETPRAWSFCSHAIEAAAGQVLVVPDATLDSRFAENPLVTGAPHIRFYVGAVLTGEDGHRLGTLCIIDNRPRPEPSTVELQRLQVLAEMVVEQLSVVRHRRLAAADRKLIDLSEAMSGVGHWRHDVRDDRITWSDEVYRIHGQSRGTYDPNLSQAVEFFAPADRDRLFALRNAALATKTGYECQHQIHRADGVVLDVMAKAVCELNALGEVVALFGVCQDVTEREGHLRAVRKSQTEYRLLADHVGDVIGRLKLDGTCDFVSSAVERLLGCRAADVVADGGAGYIWAEDLPHVHAAFQAMAQGADQQTVQYRMKHVDGGSVWVESNIRLVRDESGAPVEMVMVTRDIRERRRLEEQLRDALARAEASVQAKSEFLANMSHEIRTPLTAIIGFSDLLTQIEGLPADAQRYVRRIQTGGRGLLSVVNDVLDFSKLETGQLELDPRPFEPLAFVAETLELVAAQAANKGLTLRLTPASVLPDWVLADSARVRQILLNLLSNAIKFTAVGGVEVAITHDDRADSMLRIEVKDTGGGVPAAHRDRLFQRFSQGDSSISRQHGGTGLGLAICKSLATLMGGSIGVDSRVGYGSTFWFTVHAPVAEPAPQMAADHSGESQGRAAWILLVDDVAANRELVKALLTPFGHEFAEADNGVDAVGLAMRTPFDLILMDLQMPGMDGLAASRAIRASSEVNGRTPILALSANVLEAQIAACREAGMNDHIAKPIDLHELLVKVAHWTGPDCIASIEETGDVALTG